MVKQLEMKVKVKNKDKINVEFPSNAMLFYKINELCKTVNKLQETVIDLVNTSIQDGARIHNLEEWKNQFNKDLRNVEMKQLFPESPQNISNDYTFIKFDEHCRLKECEKELAKLTGKTGVQND